MLIYDAIDRARENIMSRVAQMIYSIARFTYFTKTSADGTTDSVEGQPLNPEENGGTSQEDVRRLGGGWGLWSVPPKGEPCLVVRAGGSSTNGVVVAAGSKRYAPSGMSDGDTALFNKTAGVTILLKASDGSITITDQNSSVVKLDGSGKVYVGGTSSAQPAVLGNSLETRLAALEAAYMAHKHAFTGTGTVGITDTSISSPGSNIKCSIAYVK